jgi:hypothetical protein
MDLTLVMALMALTTATAAMVTPTPLLLRSLWRLFLPTALMTRPLSVARPNVGPRGGKRNGPGGDSDSSNSTASEASEASVSSNSSYDETLKGRPNVGPRGGKRNGPGGNSDSNSSNSTASEESVASVSSNSSYDETLKRGPNLGRRGGKRNGPGGNSDSNSSNSTAPEASVSSNSSYDETPKRGPNLGLRGGKRNGPGGNSDSDSSNFTASVASASSNSSSAGDMMIAHASVEMSNTTGASSAHWPSDSAPSSNSSSSASSSSSSSKTGPKGKGSPKKRPSEEAWVFCHATGSFGDQLTFHVKNGKCYPDYLTWAGENCDSDGGDVITGVSEIILVGIVSLDGINSEIFNSADFSVILGTLAETVSGWEVSNMQVTATSLHARSLSVAYTHDVEFSVKFSPEEYGVNGALYSSAEALVSDMTATLQASMSGGNFVQTMSSASTLAASTTVTDVNTAELQSLEILSISYADNRLVYVYDTVSSSSVSSEDPVMSSGVIVLFVAVVALAGVAAVGMIAHSFGSYQKVSTASDSEVSERVWMSGMKSKFGVQFENLPANSNQFEDSYIGLRI